MKPEIPKWLCGLLDADGFAQIEAAVANAEKSTSCEIVPIIVRRSSVITHVPIILFCFFIIVQMMLREFYLPPQTLAVNSLVFIGEIVAAIFAAAVASRFNFIARNLTSEQDLLRQAQTRAELEFHRTGITNTTGRTGILIFVSLFEHKVIVLADKSISDQFPANAWVKTVTMIVDGIKAKRLASGFIEAVNYCTSLVAPKFPLQDGDKNELTNHLVIKE